MNIAILSLPENVKREPAQDLKEYYNSITCAEKSITINNLSTKKINDNDSTSIIKKRLFQDSYNNNPTDSKKGKYIKPTPYEIVKNSSFYKISKIFPSQAE